MTIWKKLYIGMITGIVILTTPSWAAPELHALSDIKATAKYLVEQEQEATPYKVVIKVGHLDPRLRLTKCSQPLSGRHLNKARRSANTTVVISCEGQKPWTVYVPVKVSRSVRVAVLQTPVGRGQTVQAEHIKFVDYDITRLSNGFYQSTEQIMGRQARRNLVMGAVVRPNDLLASRLISRGQRVTIVAKTNDISVRMPGKALADAAKGEVVRVQNLSSKRTVEGIALNSGVVQISM